MTDRDPGFRRVIFDLPGAHVPELMGLLGDFALQHGIAVQANISDDEPSDPSLRVGEEPEPEYDPRYITWLHEGDPPRKVAVVTHDDFRNFAADTGLPSGTGRRLGSSFIDGIYWRETARNRALHARYVLQDKRNQDAGLRADRAEELLTQLRERRVVIRQLGPGILGYFEKFCAEVLGAKPH